MIYLKYLQGKLPVFWIVIASSAGRIIHTILVYGCMQLFFPEAGFGLNNIADDIARWDFIPFTIIADIIVVLCYFTNRIETVMRQYHLTLSDEISYDLMHLQVQFLMGMISLAVLVILGIMLYQKNIDYLYYEARLDGLTGLLGRQQFFHVGQERLESYHMEDALPEKTGYFIILDVDSFKDINDTYGHPVGDQLLKEVADDLRGSFGPDNLFERLGGDEFVALISERMSREEIERALNQMKDRLKQSEIGNAQITCSIGVIPIEEIYSLERMYRHADRLLYEAKKNGKDQFVFGYCCRDTVKQA